MLHNIRLIMNTVEIDSKETPGNTENKNNYKKKESINHFFLFSPTTTLQKQTYLQLLTL